MMLPFTPRLRKAFALADRRRQESISAVDLLAGIVSLGSGVAVQLLRPKGFSENDLPSPSKVSSPSAEESVSYQGCTLRSLSEAIDEAVSQSHGYVGVEHMLAGLLKSSSQEISTIFREKEIKIDELLGELRDHM